ncbi:MAG: glucuronate isomerase [Rikenellaceae bacterium]
MKEKKNIFINEDFVLSNKYAKKLYKKCKNLPILDYHNHLSAKEIYEDLCFSTITQAWLGGDHYKWRVMRACGYDESIVSGDADDYERFLAYAKTLSKIAGNPLYHWTHLELKRYFGVDEILNENSAKEIYNHCNSLLRKGEYSVRNLLAMQNVELLCTTDDPIDSLEYHRLIADDESRFKVLPTWRPDRVMAIDTDQFCDYIGKLAQSSEMIIHSLDTLKEALQLRMNHFKAHGCIVADHGLTKFYSAKYCEKEVDKIFKSVLFEGHKPTLEESEMYKSALAFELLKMNHENGLVQQLHQGAIRNQNSKLFAAKGADVGCDSIDDYSIASELGALLDKLNSNDSLTRTIIYNLNPKDSEVMTTMIYNFNDGSVAGKMQYGAAWWFLDTKKGMENQLDVISSFGVLGEFIGMLTDSRSFLSFTRHEYFRRILCNYIGCQIKEGLLPESEMETFEAMVSDISYYNAKRYFGL